MKKIILSALAACSSFMAFSQTSAGQFLVGASLGSGSFTNSKSTTTYSNTPTIYTSDGNSTNFSINPTIGWFPINNFAIGSYLSFSSYKSSSTSSNTSSTTTSKNEYNSPSYYIGPFARFYFGGGNQGKAFAFGSYQWGSSGGTSKSSTSSGSSSETKTIPKANTYTTVGIGYEQFLSNMVGLFFQVSYNMSHSKTLYEYRPSTGTGYDYTSEYNSNYVSLSIGFQVHLNPPKK